ncbi:alkaline phosphatase family protein [Candidatus Fermentibacteria bacterium]|nr:alkaline phosphatase family protein [Candidatus Fermentibacteria bacterium]
MAYRCALPWLLGWRRWTAAFGLCALVQTGHAYESERVVLVIIDGLRYSEGLGDTTHANVPEMWALASDGAIIEPFLNDGYTYTSRAIPAIWCGSWTEVDQFTDPACGGQQNNYSRDPTVFEYFRKGLERPQEECIYVLKDVGCPWKASFDPDYGPDYWPIYRSQGYTDLHVWQQAQSILTTEAPEFMMLYLAEVDAAGHSGNWAYYLSAIATADRIVGELWVLLQEIPAYAGRTTMLVTNDHGRHTYDWTGHGCSCAGCRTIQLLAVGPDIVPNIVSNLPRTLRDITPTIGELLGFETPRVTGEPVLEILQPATETYWEEPLAVAPDLGLAPVFSGGPGPIRFRLALPRGGHGRVAVYGVGGAEVARPLDRWMPAGSHDLIWDAKDLWGRLLAPGAYITTLTMPYGRRAAVTIRMP